MSKSFQLDAYQSPDGWVNTTIKSVVELVIDNRGKTPPLAPYGIPLLEINSIYGDVKHPDPTNFEKFVSKETYGSWFRNGHPEEGDILIATVGAAGASAIVNGLKVCIAQNLIGLRPAKNIHGEFLFYITRSQVFKRQVNSVLMGGVQPSLKVPHLLNFNFHYPVSLKHQAEISKALSDTDNLINSLDQLITKKRNIQQAAMQQLLTGQRRLPGFSGEWCTNNLGDLAFFLKGAALSKSDLTTDGANKCILYGELFTIYGREIREIYSRTNANTGTPSKIGDVLLPGSTTTSGIDLASAAALQEDDVLLGGDINIIRPNSKESFDAVFLSQYLTNIAAKDIAERAQGITIIHLYGRDLRSLSIKLPTVREQSAIAAILTDMDAELAALKARRDKARQLKQGMMQELLTGRIRLV